MDKNYFDLTNTQNDISCLFVEKKDNFDCQLVDNNGVVYDGFKLAQSKEGNAITLCDISFKKSATDSKYQARLIFRKTDRELEDKVTKSDAKCIRIPFHTGKDGYREFWKMIVFLYEWREIIDLGEFNDFFAVTEKSLSGILPELAKLKNKNTMLESLKRLQENDLENIDNLVSITKLKNALEEWKKNKENDQEVSFWHPFFKKYYWIIPQAFSSSVSLFDDEFYVGGLSQGNRRGAKFVDFVVKDNISKAISMIEIKTPKKQLVAKTEYDGRKGIYSMDKEFTGAISQVLNQKDQIQKDFKFDNHKKDYVVLDPNCILIIGSKEHEKMNADQEACFELFRKNQKNIEIITFDELFQRIESILKIFEN